MLPFSTLGLILRRPWSPSQLRKKRQCQGQNESPDLQRQDAATAQSLACERTAPTGTECVGHARLWAEHFLSLTCPNNPARAAPALQRGKQKVGRGE